MTSEVTQLPALADSTSVSFSSASSGSNGSNATVTHRTTSSSPISSSQLHLLTLRSVLPPDGQGLIHAFCVRFRHRHSGLGWESDITLAVQDKRVPPDGAPGLVHHGHDIEMKFDSDSGSWVYQPYCIKVSQQMRTMPNLGGVRMPMRLNLMFEAMLNQRQDPSQNIPDAVKQVLVKVDGRDQPVRLGDIAAIRRLEDVGTFVTSGSCLLREPAYYMNPT